VVECEFKNMLCDFNEMTSEKMILTLVDFIDTFKKREDEWVG